MVKKQKSNNIGFIAIFVAVSLSGCAIGEKLKAHRGDDVAPPTKPQESKLLKLEAAPEEGWNPFVEIVTGETGQPVSMVFVITDGGFGKAFTPPGTTRVPDEEIPEKFDDVVRESMFSALFFRYRPKNDPTCIKMGGDEECGG